MDSTDIRLANEIFGATSAGGDTAHTEHQASAAAAASGGSKKRPRGAARAVEVLLRDHERYAGKSAVKNKNSTSGGSASTTSGPSRYEAYLASQDTRGGPVSSLPDMFGNVQSADQQQLSSSKALDDAVAQWGGGDGTAAGDKKGARGARIPLLRQWVLAPPPASAVMAPRWRRMDDVVALKAADSDAISSSTSEFHHVSGCFLPDGDRASDSASFFSFSEEEYNALRHTTTNGTTHVASGEASSSAPFVFDFQSSQKLFILHERFSNPLLVADRWLSSDATGRFPAKPSDGSTSISSGSSRAPTAEEIAGEYHRVSTGVMLVRRARLQSLLQRGADVNDNAGSNSSGKQEGLPLAKRHKVDADRGGVVSQKQLQQNAAQHHALLSILSKHPLLRHVPDPSEAAGAPPEDVIPDSSLGRCATNEVAKTPQQLLTALTTPSAWYNREAEVTRRAGLRMVLGHESAVNVRYQRSAADYLALIPRTAQYLQKLHGILPAEADAHSSSNEHLTRRELMSLPKDREALCTVTPCQLPAVDPALWRSTVAQLNKIQHTAGGQGGPTKEAAGGHMIAAPYDVALREALSEVPMHCTRLRLAAQAGMMLPAPRPNVLPTSFTADEDDEKQQQQPNAEDSDQDDGDTHLGSDGHGHESDYQLLKKVAQSASCNRAYSMVSEAILLTFPPSVPRLHREVEQELEKHLWDHEAALMDSGPDVHRLTAEIRERLTQNSLLRRYVVKLENLLDVSQKIAHDVKDALSHASKEETEGK